MTIDELIERWENVERVLTALTPHERRNHWSMGNWGFKTPCGTVACAAGHCAFDPWFIERGFQGAFTAARPYDNIPYLRAFDGRPFGEMVKDFFQAKYPADGIRLDDLSRQGMGIFLSGASRPVSKVIEQVQSFLKRARDYRDSLKIVEPTTSS